MKVEGIYVGPIFQCTYSSDDNTNREVIEDDGIHSVTIRYEKYKENAIILKIKNGGYIDFDNINTIFDIIKASTCITKGGYKINNYMMSNSAHHVGQLFVKKEELTPYYSKEEQPKELKIRKLKKHILADSRFRGRIEQ